MKYAFVALITLYLIVYGCSSDDSKTETAPHKKMEHSSVEKSHQPAQVGEKAQPAPPAPEQAAAEQSGQPAATETVASGLENVQKQPAAGNAEPQQLPQLVEEQALIKEHPEDTIVMPCGRVFTRKELPCNMPCPALQLQEEPLAQDEPQQEAAPANPQDELTAAMQKMVEATNDMVLVTRQMVIATEEMLKATQGVAGVAVEVIDTGKEIPQAEQPGKAAEPPAAAGAEPQAQAGSPQKDVVASMKEVVTAAKEVIEVTNEAISKALEAKQQ